MTFIANNLNGDNEIVRHAVREMMRTWTLFAHSGMIFKVQSVVMQMSCASIKTQGLALLSEDDIMECFDVYLYPQNEYTNTMPASDCKTLALVPNDDNEIVPCLFDEAGEQEYIMDADVEITLPNQIKKMLCARFAKPMTNRVDFALCGVHVFAEDYFEGMCDIGLGKTQYLLSRSSIIPTDDLTTLATGETVDADMQLHEWDEDTQAFVPTGMYVQIGGGV